MNGKCYLAIPYARESKRGIRQASWFGIVLSPDSVTSKWCKRELNEALEEELGRNKVFVVPVLYRPCDVPAFLREKAYVDLSRGKYGSGLSTLPRRFDIE
jgi:hypothetical protein